MQELVPYIEEQFRGIGEGGRGSPTAARRGLGGARRPGPLPRRVQRHLRRLPRPHRLRAYELINVYEHGNAYYDDGPFRRRLERPAHRNYLGEVDYTVRDENHMELVLGTKGRSGGQWDIWQATYSPMGDDGYPQPIWDKKTGTIDTDVAAHWKENYDLRHILERDWKTLGPKLEGKLHIYTGDMDNYYLNNAVYLMEDFLERTSSPYYGGEVDYGDRAEHCWNGDQENPNHLSRSATTRCTSRRSWSGSGRPPPSAPTRRAGGTRGVLGASRLTFRVACQKRQK